MVSGDRMMVLVCGGRDFTDYRKFADEMNKVNSEHGPIGAVVHGGSRGADQCAHLWAESARIEELVFKADWAMYGAAAGPLRNQMMLDKGKPDFVVAFPGGKGTSDMTRRARRAGLKIVAPLDSANMSWAE